MGQLFDTFFVLGIAGLIWLISCNVFFPKKVRSLLIILFPVILYPLYGFIDTECDLESNINDLIGENTKIIRPLPLLLSMLDIAPEDSQKAFVLLIVIYTTSQCIMSLAFFKLSRLFSYSVGYGKRQAELLTSVFIFLLVFLFSPLLGNPSVHLLYQFTGYSVFFLAVGFYGEKKFHVSIVFFAISVILHPMTGFVNSIMLLISIYLVKSKRLLLVSACLSLCFIFLFTRIDIVVNLLSFFISGKARVLVDTFVSNNRPLLSSILYLALYTFCSVMLCSNRFLKRQCNEIRMICVYFLATSTLALPLVLFTNQQLLSRILYVPLIIPFLLPLLYFSTLRIANKQRSTLFMCVVLAYLFSSKVPTESKPNYADLGYACHIRESSLFK